MAAAGRSPARLASRRDVLAGLAIGAAHVFAGAAKAQTQGAPTAAAAAPAERHGLSTFGDLRYPSDFPHFAYVRPDAPKGGAFAQQLSSTLGNQAFDTFNTLNIYVFKGDGAAGMNLTFDSLMARALDEPDAMYGLVARAVTVSDNGLTYRFSLRREARFHDGSPLTADDAAFSILLLKKEGHPRISQAIQGVEAAEAAGGDLIVRLREGHSRDLPLVVAGLPIFSKAYYSRRPFDAATLEAPLGSGPYRVDRFEQGRFIEFRRVADYWAADLPVARGQHNFDRLRYDYFRDRQVAFEAFKAGTFTFREEFTSREWATGYNFPAVRDGRVRRETIPDETPSGTQGWWLNTRRETFADPRVREAIGLAFDFEWTNATIMFGLYERTVSFFQNSQMVAAGAPDTAQLKLLEPFRGKVPDEVFGEPYVPPKSDGSGQDRALLRRADRLLAEAGCRREGRVLKLPDGKPLTIEFLDFQPTLLPHTQPFAKNLGLLGIDAHVRVVDAAQYQRRSDAFDYDVLVHRFSMSPTPGEELRLMFGSQSAKTPGSLNMAGVSDPVVDALIEAALDADTRSDLVAACRALDRVLRAGRYWVPMWYKPTHWLAYWDLYDRPPVKPTYDRGVPATWWYDKAKADRIGWRG